NLKQFGLAIHTYHDVTNVLPPGGRMLAQDFNNGPNWSADKGSWLLYILPYIEQQALYNKVAPTLNQVGVNSVPNPPFPAKIPLQFCPSDVVGPTMYGSTEYTSSYVANMGPQCWGTPCSYSMDQYCNQPTWGYTSGCQDSRCYNLAQIRGPFDLVGNNTRFEDVPDGLSNTLFIGE